MIITKLNGGLGNQLFQYAAAFSLSRQHNTSLKLDISYLKSQSQKITHRNFELHHFNISSNLANPLEIAELSGIRKNLTQSTVVKIRSLIGLSKYKKNLIFEPHFNYWNKFHSQAKDTYLVGFWQSEKYFSNINHIIRKEFSFSKPPSGFNSDIAEEICRANAVFLHIRRGDYVSHPDVAKLNGTCDQAYYDRALSIVADKVSDPVLYVFSDEPEWVRQNMCFPFPATVIDHNGPDDAHEDLRLMSLCRHAIIANSTFSWWGAWLIDSEDKVVVAPRKWFADPSIDTSDVIPDRWILA